MKEEKITWQTNPDGVILEDLFFQLPMKTKFGLNASSFENT